jgi:uncharacterized protein YaiE (UPF0345 family)
LIAFARRLRNHAADTQENVMKRILIIVAALFTFGLCARAEYFVVKMSLKVRVVDPSSGNLSNVTFTATNIVEAVGEDPATSTLVLDSNEFGSMLIVDNETGEMLETFASQSVDGNACAINAIGNKFYCQAFLDLFGGTMASAVGPIDQRVDYSTGQVLRYNWQGNIQGTLDATSYSLPSISVSQTAVPFQGKFTTLKRFIPSGAACSAPSATTGAASNVNSTSATLSATVSPNGLTTSAAFQWGLTLAYGNTTSAQTVLSSTGSTNLTADLTGLLPSQTYHFQVTASSTCGSVTGGDVTFTTSALTNAVTTSSLAQ